MFKGLIKVFKVNVYLLISSLEMKNVLLFVCLSIPSVVFTLVLYQVNRQSDCPALSLAP